MNKLNDTISHIQHMYSSFNRSLKADLPDNIIFTLIPNRTTKSRYLGWFFNSKWTDGKDNIHELNITPDHLNRPVKDIAETIIHEMVHLKNAIRGIEDCNRTQYHNKNFKKQAEEFGLTVTRTRTKGYAYTALGEKAQTIVNEYIDQTLKGENPFKVFRCPSESTSKGPSNKRMVSLDRDLADLVESISSNKLGPAVASILTQWIRDQTP